MKKEDINTVAEENIKDNINNGVDENVDNVEQTEQTEEAVEDNTAASTEEAAEEQVDPLEKALAEIEELKKQALYKQAEFENYRKRTIKEKADLILGGGEKTVTAILPVLDDFERALADKSEDPAAIREGMQLIYNKFVKTLEGLGVKKIETENAGRASPLRHSFFHRQCCYTQS